MTKRLSIIFPILPLTLLTVACGSGALKNTDTSESDLASMSMTEESEEAVADHVGEVASELALEESQSLTNNSLGLVSKRDSTLEKTCSVAASSLTLKKSKSVDKDSQRNTKRGRVERSIDVESSFERVYSAAEGHSLPLQCQSEQGPVKILEDKLGEFSALSLSAKSNRAHSIVIKKDGEVIQSRKSETSGSRTATFASASSANGQLTINKSVAISTTTSVSSFNKGLSSTENQSYQTQKDAPLMIEVLRESGTEKLISKTIKSGHVQILRGNGAKIDIVYDMVKFSDACKPVSGHLEVSKANLQSGPADKLSIEFKNGEAFVSKNGGAQEKMDSLNYRLESCRSK